MDKQIVFEAKFNPKIKTYFLIIGSLVLFFTFIGWILLPFWLLGLGKYAVTRYYNSLRCDLYTDVLHFKKGILFQVEKSIPLENIQDLTFKQGPLMRWLGLSSFAIETAGGQGNTAGGDLTLVGIVDPHKFRQIVLDQRKQLKTSSSIGQVQTLSDMDVLLDISATLKRIEEKLDK